MKLKLSVFIPFIIMSLSLSLHAQITIEAGAELTIMDSETVTAEGNIDNAGKISGKGTLNIAGNFTTTGTFAITIGPDQFTHTTLDVTGNVTLGGNTTVTNDSYIPSSGDQATIISCGNAIGSNFSNGSNNTWFTNYNSPISGDFTISYSMALPIELISFSGRPFMDDIILEWETATELNNEGFYIQHSKDGIEWQKLDFVAGMGTSEKMNKYIYSDSNPFSKINYYRLKQVDFDGQFSYSEVLSIVIHEKDEILIYPNPTTGQLAILGIDTGNFKITNNLGKTIMTSTFSQASIDISELPNGLYFLQIGIDSEQINNLIIKH